MRSMQSPPISRTRANVLGVGIDALNMQTAVSAFDAAFASGHKDYLCVTGVHGIMEARDEHLRTILNNSFLTIPDGMPTVWVGKWQNQAVCRRVWVHVGSTSLLSSSVFRCPVLGFRTFL